MNLQKFVIRASAFALALGLAATAAQALAADVWLIGVDPETQKGRHVSEPADYMDLFKPGAPWKQAASGLAVFKFGTRFVLQSDDAELKTVIDDLKPRHIAFAVELGVLESGGPGSCGFGVEGYGRPDTVERVAKRVKALGGRIDYAAMDEPVWFGHVVDNLAKTTGRGCQYSIPQVADMAAAKIAVLRRYFPDIKIGDVEPVSARAPGGPQSIEDILTFETLLRQKTGDAPVFVHADLAWASPGWQPLLQTLATRVHAGGIRFGVICDGDVSAGSNEAWVAQALQRCQQVAANPRIRPDDLLAQTWEPLPTRMLPESDPGALTFEALQLETMRRDRQDR